ncbi:hypothetical protein F7R13_25180 [Burkholderia territorii]|uniref:Uncharacterized protein n=1 Tax=Burkholderia territorii TaxID=1503055 RepID=A0A6L3NA77_9BURK|nr:hypothetical protein F7R13_25180 [Burkholderia territorii]
MREIHAQWAALYINQKPVSKSGPSGPLILTMAVTIGMLRDCPEPRVRGRCAAPAGSPRDRYNRSF